MFTLTVNDKTIEADVEADTPMLWVIRDEIGLTGTKFGCGVAACGACTVLLDGVPTRSCQLTAENAKGKKITTIEGISGDVAKAVQKAWNDLDVVQCGYCQSGQIIQAVGLLSENPSPTDEDIDDAMDGNLCRCATYVRIRAAIHEAAKTLKG